MVWGYNLSMVGATVPFLLVYLTGMVISVKRLPYQKQPALLASIACGVLIMTLLVNVSISIWLQWIVQDGSLSIAESVGMMANLQKISIALYYLSLAALACGVFIGRKATGGSFREPAIIVAAVVMVACLNLAIASGLIIINSDIFQFVLWAMRIVAAIALLVALYGWRNDAHLKTLPPVVEETANPNLPQTGPFREQDYIPFIAGVLVLGGLLIVPFIYGMFLNIYYPQALFSSLLSCGIFLYAHDRRGNFSFGKFLLAYLFILFQILRTSTQQGGANHPIFIAGGLLGIALMLACGWAGIAIARVYRSKVGGH